MSDYTYPGVYWKEVSSGPGPIYGVSTSTLGLIGWSPKGEVDKPIIATSFPEFANNFGSFNSDGIAAHTAYAFFANGGSRMYFVRVAPSDALDSAWDLERTLSASETVSTVAQPSGMYSLSLDKAPVVAGSLTALTFNNAVAANVNVFDDDGAGALVFNASLSGASAAGGSGSIDYDTGEITITLADPSQYAGGAQAITAMYSYVVFKFQMKWPGVAGNNYRVRVVPGSDDYLVSAQARWTRFTVLVDEDVNEDPSSPSWVNREMFSDVVFDDTSSANYVVTVVNADGTGSSLIEVVEYGNEENPIALQGTSVTAEDFAATQQHSDGSSTVVPNAYDGAWKGWQYETANAVFPRTFTASFKFNEDGMKIGTAATPAAATATVLSLGSVSAPAAIVPGSVQINATLTTAGVVAIVDNGTGTLWDGVAGSAGTINYLTGVISVIDVSGVTAWAADTFVAGSNITIECQYNVAVAISDDGDGNLALAATQATGYPQKFQLNSAGPNTIDYDTGEFILNWKIVGDPAAGPAGASSQLVSYYTDPADSVIGLMAGGTDGSGVTSNDISSPALAVDRKGIYAFGKVNELMQLVAADFQTDLVVSDALITYAELMKDKFVILTVPKGLSYQEAVNWKKFQLARYTSYAALYYPHIKISDPVSKTNIDIPCGGHVAGIYARTDADERVSSAPAGMGKGNINWSVGLEVDLEPEQVGVLNQNKINSLVSWEYTGRVVWGARTLDAAGGEWPYIQMRRLFLFVEKSIFQSTHIHVFKDNNSLLWSSIRNQVTTFLTTLQDGGYFAGETASDSFFVICDRTNNPQSTVDQGFVFCDVGIAPTKPAEFIVFRFMQKSL